MSANHFSSKPSEKSRPRVLRGRSAELSIALQSHYVLLNVFVGDFHATLPQCTSKLRGRLSSHLLIQREYLVWRHGSHSFSGDQKKHLRHLSCARDDEVMAKPLSIGPQPSASVRV